VSGEDAAGMIWGQDSAMYNSRHGAGVRQVGGIAKLWTRCEILANFLVRDRGGPRAEPKARS